MMIADWLAIASADAERRGMPELVPLLEGLAKATERLRAADWNDDADRDTARADTAEAPPQGAPSGTSEGGGPRPGRTK